MTEPPRHFVSVQALVTDADGRVLLVREPRRGWEMPGGIVEHGEGLVEAVRREVLEESGIDVAVESLAGIYSRVDGRPMVLHLFRCRWVAGDCRPSEETPEVAWFELDEALSRIEHAPTAARIRDAAATGALVAVAYTQSPFRELERRAL